ncbi:MAG: flagellar hook-basal body complex protein [Phycisphaerales bacterium]
MASTVSLLTGLSGLNAHSRRLEVIGNNISNVNTTAFKSNRMLFSTQINRTMSVGMSPQGANGGTNPGQIGLGVRVAGTQRDMRTGAIAVTGIQTDLAVDGAGQFIVERDGEQFFTRAGEFQFNANNEITTVRGERLMGYGVDDNFNLQEGSLSPVTIPLGTMTIAEATSTVNLAGNLNADGDVATTGSIIEFDALTAGGGAATLATPLISLDPAGAFAVGDSITVSGAERGGKSVQDATFAVEDGTETIEDFLTFLQNILGVVPDGGYAMGDVTGGPEDGSFNVDAMGVIQFIGNYGESNDLDLQTDMFSVKDTDGIAKSNPFSVSKTVDATGESVRTTFAVYDSLGTELLVDVTMVLVETDDNGTYWRAFMHSGDDTDRATFLENGERDGMFSTDVPLLSFDNFGRMTSPGSFDVELDRDDTGAGDPLSFSLNFASQDGELTAFSDSGGESALGVTFQDGAPLGVLTSFNVGPNGVISGGFSNNQVRTLGQLVLATFTNEAGLVEVADNLWRIGPNSGPAQVARPGEFGSGRVQGGSLELSNVDLGSQFIEMITTSTGYSASSRVISTADELLQQLLVIGR